MGNTLSLLLLVIAISIDSFSTGIAYGIRKIRIPMKSIIVIALCTAFSLGIAMAAGQVISNFLSEVAASRIGGVILIIIGAWVIYQFFKTDKNEASHIVEKREFTWEIRSLGLVIRILRKPVTADFDRSGTINGFEALMLGIALSLDAFGAGIGAGMLGLSPIFLASSAACMSGIFLFSGLQIGNTLSRIEWLERFSFFPGILLIIIGVLKM